MKTISKSLIMLALAVMPQLMSAQKKSDPQGFVTYSLPSTTITLDVEAVQEKFYAGPYAKYAVTPANGDQMLKDYVSIHGGAIGKQDYAAGITEAFETLRNEKKSEQEKRYAECN